MIIKKGMEFIDESGDYRVIRIEGKLAKAKYINYED